MVKLVEHSWKVLLNRRNLSLPWKEEKGSTMQMWQEIGLQMPNPGGAGFRE
jgi:hypothetical protein